MSGHAKPPTDSNVSAEGRITIARVVRARGIKGEVACDIETAFPERFEMLELVTIRKSDGSMFDADIEDVWFHKDRVILKIAGYDSMTASEGLVGSSILIPESEAALLPDGEFYEFDVIGSSVVTVTGDPVGKVVRILRTGGTDVLVVEGAGTRETPREIMIPFADEICIEVDPGARQIRIDPPDGLLDL
jgi:16S rRNA processing protein RimM